MHNEDLSAPKSCLHSRCVVRLGFGDHRRVGKTVSVFEGFVEGMIPGGALRLFGRWGGSGPAVLLLHGHPRTSATWHRVAPQLVKSGFTVVCLDLPGYGRSDKPMPTDDHVPHCKRVGAGQLLIAMTSLGHERFSLVGHDRAAFMPFGLPWTIRAGSPKSRCLTACRSANTLIASTFASPRPGGTGSSSPSRRYPNG